MSTNCLFIVHHFVHRIISLLYVLRLVI